MTRSEYMNTYPSLVNLMIFAGAMAMSWGGTWLLLRKAHTWGVDHPDTRRKRHDKPLSRLGGLPIFVALIAGFVVMELRFPDFLSRWWPLVVTNIIIFAVGIMDDFKPQGAKLKLLGQIGASTILYALGVSIDTLTNPFGSQHFDLGWWSYPVTVLWLVTVPNIVNLIDGMDGLAAGFGMFLCLTLAFVGHYAHKPEVVTVSVIMGGALTGFLYFNFPPARIFLGDGGSYLIGFFIASMSVFTSNKGTVVASLLVVIVALGVPILDTLFTIIRRAIRGVPIFRADAEHIHHRLITLGFTKTQALAAMYSICLVLSLIGISIFWTRGFSLPIAGAALFLLGLGAARYLGYVQSWRDIRGQFRGALKRRQEMLYCGTYGDMLEWEAERCNSMEEFMPLLRVALQRMGFHLEPGPGLVELKLTLDTHQMLTLYRASEGEAERWLAKADLLTPALNLATQRWGPLSVAPSTNTPGGKTIAPNEPPPC